MKSFRLILVSGLLTGMAAYVQAAPDWSADIGTGHAVDGGNSATTVNAPPEPAATASVPWSAFVALHVNLDKTGELSRETFTA
jgi:hypothetical protein